MERIDDEVWYGGKFIRIVLFKSFKSRMMKQTRGVRCGWSIENIFCSKELKWGILKVDDNQENKLGKDGE